eukprot:6189046-Pleurochrysis_carterae.AAC.6
MVLTCCKPKPVMSEEITSGSGRAPPPKKGRSGMSPATPTSCANTSWTTAMHNFKASRPSSAACRMRKILSSVRTGASRSARRGRTRCQSAGALTSPSARELAEHAQPS